MEISKFLIEYEKVITARLKHCLLIYKQYYGNVEITEVDEVLLLRIRNVSKGTIKVFNEIKDLIPKEQMTDKVVNDVINQFKERSNRGIEKYGTTLQENNTDDFLQHFKEELMDAILYIQKLQSQRNGN